MTRKRFDTAPQFNVDEEGLVIQQVAGSTASLLEIKDHTGSSLMTVNAAGEMTTAAPSTIDELTVSVTALLPQDTTIGAISASELGTLDGVTSNIQQQINDKAPLASPTLTGTPTAPTATAATNTTQIATTEFVRTEIANLIASSPTTLDTLDELAAALGDDPNFATTVTNSLATKAPLANPALTGTPTAPTAAVGTNTTQIATTAFVMSAIPAGTVQDYVGETEPDGWKFLNGQTLTGAQTTYPQLWAAAPSAWRSGANLVLPDARGRVSVAKAGSGTFNTSIGATGGAETVTLTAAQSGVPAHDHANSLSGNSVAAASHRHEWRFALNDNYYQVTGTQSGMTGSGAYRYSTSAYQGSFLDGTLTDTRQDAGYETVSSGQSARFASVGDTTASSNQTVSISNAQNAAAAASQAHNNLQPYIVLNKIIKVH